MAECERDRNKVHVPHHQAQMRGYPKTELASRNEREDNFINTWGFETQLGQRGFCE